MTSKNAQQAIKIPVQEYPQCFTAQQFKGFGGKVSIQSLIMHAKLSEGGLVFGLEVCPRFSTHPHSSFL
jgi:hypothetical protein